MWFAVSVRDNRLRTDLPAQPIHESHEVVKAEALLLLAARAPEGLMERLRVALEVGQMLAEHRLDQDGVAELLQRLLQARLQLLVVELLHALRVVVLQHRAVAPLLQLLEVGDEELALSLVKHLPEALDVKECIVHDACLAQPAGHAPQGSRVHIAFPVYHLRSVGGAERCLDGVLYASPHGVDEATVALRNASLQQLAKQESVEIVVSVLLDCADNALRVRKCQFLEAVPLIQVSIHILFDSLKRLPTLQAALIMIDLLRVDLSNDVVQLLHREVLLTLLRLRLVEGHLRTGPAGH